LRLLAALFAIEVCAYAIMENHYHLILRTRPDIVALWSDREVATRWLTLFPQHRDISGAPMPPTEKEITALADRPERIAELRKRLCSLSWFMGRLNEFIARAANREDKVKGRFWESRFKCQALLDEAATACCMVYVDLNLIRAGLAGTPEESDYTSIQERIRAWRNATMNAGAAPNLATGQPMNPASVGKRITVPENATVISDHVPDHLSILAHPLDDWLCPIQSESGRRGILQMTPAEYFDLVDKSGRMVRLHKRGAIDADLEPILRRIGANPDAWFDTVSHFGSNFRLAAGLVSSLRNYADRLGRRWLQGAAMARTAFGSPRPRLA
jgi:REP element-mobilizing transposase RayT